MRILGIDPGLTTTGYGVVERRGGALAVVGFGALRTSTQAPVATRLADLSAGVAKVLGEFCPDAVAAERVFFNSNVRTAMAVGQASGVALARAAEAGLEVFHYTPTEVKQSVVGFGAATKKQVGAMVASLLALSSAPTPADAADACALAICHINRSGLRRAIEGALA
jgi:crossover junction endodeoxyribonuclease RuvC